MRKLLTALLFSLLLTLQPVWADPATPVPIRMRQPDGSYITLRIHGDEFYRWYSSEDGKTLYVCEIVEATLVQNVNVKMCGKLEHVVLSVVKVDSKSLQLSNPEDPTQTAILYRK